MLTSACTAAAPAARLPSAWPMSVIASLIACCVAESRITSFTALSFVESVRFSRDFFFATEMDVDGLLCSVLSLARVASALASVASF